MSQYLLLLILINLKPFHSEVIINQVNISDSFSAFYYLSKNRDICTSKAMTIAVKKSSPRAGRLEKRVFVKSGYPFSILIQ